MIEASRQNPRLRKLWDRFVSGLDADLSELRPEIAESWRRCRAGGVAPNLRRAPETSASPSPLDEDLTRAGSPVVSFLHDALVGANTLICLANREAGMLLSIGGHHALDVATEINALPGSLWTELAAGTNVFGTGVLNPRPLDIRWQEHYVEEWQKWACCSAPIFHPFHRGLIGALAISGVREAAHPRMLDLAIHASALITDSLRKSEMERRLVLGNALEQFLRRYPDGAIVAVDACGYATQANQRAELLLDEKPWTGRRLASVRGLEALADLARAHSFDGPREVFVRLPNVRRLVVHPVSHESRLAGHVLIFTPSRSAPPTVRLPHEGRAPDTSKGSWTASFTFADVVGDSAALQSAMRAALRLAATEYPILVVGESGTGKELFAHAIHSASPRHEGPFVAFNCGTLSAELVVAEMCGHEPGSFTGADRRTRRGMLDVAHRGTLFLDELQDMAPKAQILLLRFLENGTFVRVGGTYPVRSDVRVIAASNVPVVELERTRAVRPDLLYRLNCLTIELPPLRERSEDIRPIAEKYLRHELSFSGDVEEEVWEILRQYGWPGNVRELYNVLLRAVLVCNRDFLTPAGLPRDLLTRSDRRSSAGTRDRFGQQSDLKRILCEAKGDVREAARRLGVHRSTIYRRLARTGHVPD